MSKKVVNFTYQIKMLILYYGIKERNKSRPNEWMIFYFKLVFFVKLVHIMHGCALETEEVWNGSTRTF